MAAVVQTSDKVVTADLDKSGPDGQPDSRSFCGAGLGMFAAGLVVDLREREDDE